MICLWKVKKKVDGKRRKLGGVREEWRDKTGEKVFQEEHPNFCHAPVNVLTASVWSTGGSVIQPNRARQRGAARSSAEQHGAGHAQLAPLNPSHAHVHSPETSHHHSQTGASSGLYGQC